MSLVLGLDVSTTAAKAVILDRAGRTAAAGRAEYSYQTPRPLWAEADPRRWWEGAAAAIREALAQISSREVEAVGLAGQMHGCVLLDSAGEVVRPAILWNDQRTAAQCDEIRRRLGDRLLSITGNDALTGFTAPKLLWVREEEPESWARTAQMLLPKDYVRFRLTGESATDKADGAGTLLMDTAARAWSEEMLAALEINPDWLPTAFEGPEITGTVHEEAARATGLTAGTPVVAGGGDQAANAVGCGAVDPGTVALSLGTSGVVFAPTREPVTEPEGRVHSFCHCLPGRWHLMGVMLSAAGALRWFRDALAPGTGFAELDAEAATAPAGAEGLLFAPYLTGERTPHPDPAARGAFVGLTARHGRGHMVRALMEGVAFGLRDSLQLMESAGAPRPEQIRASGGGTKSPLWRQILADALQAEIAVTATAEGAAAGAGLLAATGAGWFDSVGEAAAALVKVTQTTPPGPDQKAYQNLHPLYQALYPALSPTFHSLTES